MRRGLARYVAVMCVAVSATLAAVSVYSTARRTRTEDRNGDGRPDVWRRYSDRGELVEVDIDSNFDGRPDIQESYEGGALVRRDSDRNFNDQIDLVEEFDSATHEHIRSVVDVDDDGTADLLVVFSDGRPVFLKYAAAETLQRTRAGAVPVPSSSSARFRHGAEGLAPLANPFRDNPSLGGGRRASAPASSVGLSTSGGLPESRADLAGLMAASRLDVLEVRPAALLSLCTGLARAPPVS